MYTIFATTAIAEFIAFIIKKKCIYSANFFYKNINNINDIILYYY